MSENYVTVETLESTLTQMREGFQKVLDSNAKGQEKQLLQLAAKIDSIASGNTEAATFNALAALAGSPGGNDLMRSLLGGGEAQPQPTATKPQVDPTMVLIATMLQQQQKAADKVDEAIEEGRKAAEAYQFSIQEKHAWGAGGGLLGILLGIGGTLGYQHWIGSGSGS